VIAIVEPQGSQDPNVVAVVVVVVAVVVAEDILESEWDLEHYYLMRVVGNDAVVAAVVVTLEMQQLDPSMDTEDDMSDGI
jgi:hypothetical protein